MLPMVIVINMRVIYIIVYVSEFCRHYSYRCKEKRGLKVPIYNAMLRIKASLCCMSARFKVIRSKVRQH